MKKKRGYLQCGGYLPKKVVIIMKCWCFLMLGLCLGVSANTWAQEERVNLDLEQVSLEKLFEEIQKQTGYSFIFNSNQTEKLGTFSVHAREESVSNLLNRILEKTDMFYELKDNLIIVLPGKAKQVPQVNQITISGIIKDEDGKPLPGVTVLIKGTTIGVSSDRQGRFRIMSPAGKVTLQFSFVGVKTKLVEYKGEDELVVIMEEDMTHLEEVVVTTGYQTFDKRTQTSAISSVRAEEIMIPGVNSIDQMLEGRIPELAFMMNSGEVGATPRLRVRGTSTLLGNREPLWVLDGIVMTDPVDIDPEELNNPDFVNIIGNAIAGINPQDIERIDVLKDASATALYGTRAANGVIVVTTKKGSISKPSLSYNHSSKVTRRPRYTDRAINLMNSQERVQFGKNLADLHYSFPTGMANVGYEGALFRLQTGLIDYKDFLDEVTRYETVNTDWFKILTRDAYSHSHSLSVRGGTEAIRYYTSIGIDRDNGVSKTTYTERYTLNSNLDVNFTPKFRMSTKIRANVQKKNHLMTGIDAMNYAYNTTRALPCYNEDGTLFYYEQRRGGYSVGNSSNYFRYNILNEIENSTNSYEGKGASIQLNLQYKILPTWDVDVTGSYSINSTRQDYWWGEKTAYIASLRNGEYGSTPIPGQSGNCILPYGGILRTVYSDTESWTFRVQSNYRKIFGSEEQHLLTALLGYEMNQNKSKTDNQEERGYLKDRGMSFINISSLDLSDYPHYLNWIQSYRPTLTRGLTNSLSGYVSISYSFKEYFTLNVNGRTDASNKFGSRSNERFLPVWSVSGMWNIKETFFKDLRWLTEWRIRSSYGKQGNMLDGQTPNMLINLGSLDTYYNEYVSTVSSYPNPNLRWEKTDQVNVGMTLNFFKSRLNTETNFYYKKTSDVFTSVSVAPTNGITSYVMNNGDLENTGFSILLSGTPIQNKDFSWRMSTSYSVNKNKVKTDAVEKYERGHYLNGTAIVNGKSVGTFFSYKFLGLNADTGIPIFDDYADRKHLLEGQPLESVILTVMEDSGTREPVFHGNLTNTLTWRGLSLTFNLAYSLGSKVRLFPLYSPVINGIRAENNVRKEFTNRWQARGDERYTDIPVILSPSDPDFYSYTTHYSSDQHNKVAAFASSTWDMYDNSDIRVVSGNYLKMQSLSLRYSLRPNTLKRLPFSSASVSFNTQNLFTISAKALKGQDPSQAGFDKPGLSVRPVYTLGLNVSF